MLGPHPSFTLEEAATYLNCSVAEVENLLRHYPTPRFPSGPDAGKLMPNCFMHIAEEIVGVSKHLGSREALRRDAARISTGGCGG